MMSEVRLVALLLAGLAFFFPSRARGETLDKERLGDDLRVLELRLGQHILEDALLAYLTSEGLFVPLSEVMAAVDFPVTVEPVSATASGWFLRESRRFDLDLKRRQVWIAGQPGDYIDRLIALQDDDIYVATPLLAHWFPVDLEVRLQRSQILLHSREKLPVELKLERQRKWLQSQNGARMPGHSNYSRHPLPYRWLDWPAVDHTISFSLREDRHGEAHPDMKSSLLATGDLLRMNAELHLRLAGDSNLEPRLRLERQDPDANLFGLLAATEFHLGDIFTPQRFLVSRESHARGFKISSFPLDRPQEFDRTTLRGDALPGWEVELYHNERLIDFQIVAEESRYEFTGVPLYFGLNLLRLIFHGPQGQRREKVERILIGQNLIDAGKSYYRFALQQHGRRLFPEAAEELDPELLAGEVGDPRDKLRYFFELERGLRQDLSVAMSLHSLPLQDGRHTYASVGLLGTRKGMLVSAHLVADTAGGWAGRLATDARLSAVDLRFEHREFLDFLSEETGEVDPLASSSALTIDRRLGAGRRRPFALTASFEHERHAAGTSRLRLTTRIAANLRRFAFNNALHLSQQRDRETHALKVSGDLLLTARNRRLEVRGGLRYVVEPQLQMQDVQLSLSWQLRTDLNLRSSVRYGLADEISNICRASLSWRLPTFALGLDTGYDDRGGLSSSLSLTYSFRREPYSGGWRSRSRSLATQGLATARAYLDNNANGQFDHGDKPLQGVRFTTHGSARGERSNREGIAWIDGLVPYQPSDLGIDLGSLEDPFWIPERHGVELVPRPGRVAQVDFPVVSSGEVDGTVYLHQAAKRQTVSKVELQLVDPLGEVRYEVTSTFDGFYLFEKVLPGRYVLRINPEQVHRLKLLPPPVREIVIGINAVVSGMDLVLERRAVHTLVSDVNSEPEASKPNRRGEEADGATPPGQNSDP